MSNYSSRLQKVIPGGAHTYSRGDDQFPSNAPPILARGEGAYVFDVEEKRYLDYSMACRAVNIGHAEEEIDASAIRQIKNGNNLSRPSLIELQAAEILVDLIESVDMVKFTKNGSTAVTAAVKLARGFTGRDLVARCADHPFFSYDDWFIGSTQITKGIPERNLELTKTFKFNNLKSLQTLIEQYPDQISCVVMEPATLEEPKNDFLKKVHILCQKHGIIFILDEMITGFRWHLKGAQYYYNVKPDLCTFGKGMANGFSVACVAGRKELMELGAIDSEGHERLFLLSTTHGAEMSSLGAFVASVNFIIENHVIDHVWSFGNKLMDLMRNLAKKHDVEKYFKVCGVPCSPYYLTLDEKQKNSLPLRTLFLQEMIKNGVLMQVLAPCFRHGEKELQITKNALDNTFKVYRKATMEGVEKYLQGPAIKPVFRKFN